MELLGLTGEWSCWDWVGGGGASTQSLWIRSYRIQLVRKEPSWVPARWLCALRLPPHDGCAGHPPAPVMGWMHGVPHMYVLLCFAADTAPTRSSLRAKLHNI